MEAQSKSRKNSRPSSLTQYSVTSEVVTQRLGEGMLLVQLATNRSYELNATGTRLWVLLVAGYDPVEMERRIVKEFSIAPARAAREISVWLKTLQRAGLLKTTPKKHSPKRRNARR